MIGYGKKINRIYNGPPYMRGGEIALLRKR